MLKSSDSDSWRITYPEFRNFRPGKYTLTQFLTFHLVKVQWWCLCRWTFHRNKNARCFSDNKRICFILHGIEIFVNQKLPPTEAMEDAHRTNEHRQTKCTTSYYYYWVWNFTWSFLNNYTNFPFVNNYTNNKDWRKLYKLSTHEF